MSNSAKSSLSRFLKIIFCAALIFGAYIIGDNLGYKRGYQETAEFTLSKLGIAETVDDYGDYDTILDEYLAESKSIDKSIENILSAERLGETAANLVTEFINGLFGE
ncbi:MAG: hypothetical protein LBQ88_05105 [Treponema sp.]|jgi:hypothetical protein|nr:hypothetical protein [Treponema sp.]